MLAASKHNVSARVREANAYQRKRPIDIDVERTSIGNAVHDADPCPRGPSTRVLYCSTARWYRKRGENQHRYRDQRQEAMLNVNHDSYPSRHRRLQRNRTKETRRS